MDKGAVTEVEIERADLASKLGRAEAREKRQDAGDETLANTRRGQLAGQVVEAHLVVRRRGAGGSYEEDNFNEVSGVSGIGASPILHFPRAGTLKHRV